VGVIVLGPTGNYPQGKADVDDCGELNIMLSVRDGNIIIEFGTAVTWIGMDPSQAIQVGQGIIDFALEQQKDDDAKPR